jgi:hypothetical protein
MKNFHISFTPDPITGCKSVAALLPALGTEPLGRQWKPSIQPANRDLQASFYPNCFTKASRRIYGLLS